uniref:Protein LURP-one-related 11-like n=1 Tax=Ananas comosus var. bracteatus TaxID=296719 RepID=A0A6V7PCH0_ANACO|nr:unnamed protein product [Ananas comosus var. bracteatus]
MSEMVQMTKVHPLPSSSSSSSSQSSSSSSITQRREVYTVWMKSLVFNGNGCTIYNSDGRIVYRVDNYDCKCSAEVFLMDHGGKTLLKILRKKLRVFGQWEGHRCCGADEEGEEPWFRVQKACGSLRKSQSSEACTVRVECGTCFKIDGWAHKSEYRIKSMDGEVVAEVKRKQTTNGVVLGEDVLSLVVEPSVDHLLIMGLVVVCGLINHCM